MIAAEFDATSRRGSDTLASRSELAEPTGLVADDASQESLAAATGADDQQIL